MQSVTTTGIITHLYTFSFLFTLCITAFHTNDTYSLAKDNDVDEILNYVELVLGAVVMCPNKAKFIENIFKLDSATQKILQVYIQRVMSSAIDVSTDTEVLNVDSASSGISEELIRAQEMIKHLSNERNRLLETIASVEGRYSALHDDHEELQVKCKELENDRNKYELERLRVSSSTPSTAVMMELDESKRSLDLLNVEHEKLKVENKKLIVNTNLSKELVAKLEQEKAQISDELDIARSKASQLSKVEATVRDLHLTHSPTHSLTYSLTYLLTHLLGGKIQIKA